MSKPKRPDAEIAAAKWLLCERIATAGKTLTEAITEFRISYWELKRWRDSDAQFVADLKDAQDHLTEIEADRLKRLHVEIPDPKVCTVAGNHLKFWLEKRNPKVFGQKIEIEDNRPDLLAILSAAVARLYDEIAPPLKTPAIELKPVERRDGDDDVFQDDTAS